jgi:hypothetical protein
MKFLETGDKLWDKGSFQIYTENQCIQRGGRMFAIIFNHHASNGGIPSGSDEKTFKTGVVLKKSSVIANCTSQPDARHIRFTQPPPGGIFAVNQQSPTAKMPLRRSLKMLQGETAYRAIHPPPTTRSS